MNFAKITFLLLIAFFFISCKENNKVLTNKTADDYIISEAFGIININSKMLQKAPSINEFIEYRLSKTDEFKILKELGFSSNEFKQIQICLTKNEFFILRGSQSFNLEEVYNKFIKDASGRYSGELLTYEHYQIYRISRKDENRFICQVLPDTLIIGSQNDILTSLSANEIKLHPLLQQIDLSSPISIAAQKSSIMPPQLQSLISLTGKSQLQEKLNIEIEADFADERSCKTTENMAKTLLSFAPLPAETRESLKFSSTSTQLKISGKVSDQDAKTYMESKDNKKTIVKAPGAPLQKEIK